MSWLGKSRDDDEPDGAIPHWFRVDLSPVMHARLLNVIATQSLDPTNVAIREALELAERIDTPYTPPVDWDALERRARDQGYDVVDQIWDAKRKWEQ